MCNRSIRSSTTRISSDDIISSSSNIFRDSNCRLANYPIHVFENSQQKGDSMIDFQLYPAGRILLKDPMLTEDNQRDLLTYLKKNKPQMIEEVLCLDCKNGEKP